MKYNIDELFKEYKKDDREAYNKLINYYLPVAIDYIKTNHSNSYNDEAELLSLAGYATVETLKKHRNPLTFEECLKKEITREIHKMFADDKLVALNNEIDADTFEDDILDNYTKAFLIDSILKIVESMPESQRDIITYSFGLFGKDKLTERSLAEFLHIKPRQVMKVKKLALEKLKLELCNAGLLKKEKQTKDENKNEDLFTILDFDKQTIEMAIKKLNPSEQRIVYSRFGYNLNLTKSGFFHNNDERKYYFKFIIPHLKAIILNMQIPVLYPELEKKNTKREGEVDVELINELKCFFCNLELSISRIFYS